MLVILIEKQYTYGAILDENPTNYLRRKDLWPDHPEHAFGAKSNEVVEFETKEDAWAVIDQKIEQIYHLDKFEMARPRYTVIPWPDPGPEEHCSPFIVSMFLGAKSIPENGVPKKILNTFKTLGTENLKFHGRAFSGHEYFYNILEYYGKIYYQVFALKPHAALAIEDAKKIEWDLAAYFVKG